MKMQKDLELHREAELFMGRADLARVQNRREDAAAHDRRAAELEAQVFDLLPLDRPKTRGITAISSVALYRKAGALDQAIRQARSFLAPGNLPDFARLDLEEMIEEMRAEQYVSATYRNLTARQQKVLALSLAGVTPEEIAARFGVSPRAVQRTMQRARRQLQATGSIEENGSQDDAMNGLRQKLDALIA
ncbi:MAG TPA: sigma factor-like helix-turn-helix DNA-binding protein [Chloroflexota bacterium]|nr:sigma factor-like helix-turn-helix DNA-binding protein [Chloroflexota bacterium]